MAKILDKDPADYQRERDGFLRDLQHFHDTRGTPFRRIPKIGGREIDLFLLYSLVTAQGGWMKVNSRNDWSELFEQFDLPTKCVNNSVALKQVYLRYLDRYEKVHFLGEEAERGSDDDEESRHKRWSARALHSVPLNYNHQQHNIADSIRAYNGLSADLYKPSDYERLALSLVSPLPNEQDFAINVCTLLSNEGKHTLKLEKCPRLVNFLLAHAGVFQHSSLRDVFTEVYSNVRKHSLESFWHDVLERAELVVLTDEKRFYQKELRKELHQQQQPAKPVIGPFDSKPDEVLAADVASAAASASASASLADRRTICADNDSDSVDGGVGDGVFVVEDDEEDLRGRGFKLKRHPEDRDLFCLGRTHGTQDYVGQRVLQVANILRNLSFGEDNATLLAGSQTFLRFLLLCSASRWNALHQMGLDMLGNVAADIAIKDIEDPQLTDFLVTVVCGGLDSRDRMLVLASLEILNKLSQNEQNEEFLQKSLEPRTYHQVCSFLTLHDVMLLIYTLECLYSLSSLGERACACIIGVHGIIDTLVSLITVEGKSYGPKACIGMKLVETVPGVQQVVQQQGQVQQGQVVASGQVINQPATVTASPSSRPTTPMAVLKTTPSGARQIQVQVQTPTATVSLPVTVSPSPQQLVQQQHAHQQAVHENEQFALAWLRANYELNNVGKVEHQEMYKHYITSCNKLGRRGVIAPLHFPRCVRSIFGGTVGPNPAKVAGHSSGAAEAQYYDGIRLRATPLVINFQSNIGQSATARVVATPTGTVQQKITVQQQQQQPKTVINAATGATVTLAPVQTLTLVAEGGAVTAEAQLVPASPASPILKAQLSAPSKQKESPVVADSKSQVQAHPHLSQALLASGGGSTPGTSKETISVQNNSSLIKSLLATKVNECMNPLSMKTAVLQPAAAHEVAQVAQRQQQQQQQRLLAQQQQLQLQQQQQSGKKSPPKTLNKNSRVNGARTLVSDPEIGETVVSSTSPESNHVVGVRPHRRDSTQQQPPPLAPLSTSATSSARSKLDPEDSDSTGNNSLASSICNAAAGLSSAEDGENSLTSFEGILLNGGVPNAIDIDAPLHEDSSNSKDSSSTGSANKPLMLADLLEKKVEKREPPPIINGIIDKQLRGIADKGLELVENHIEKVLTKAQRLDETAEAVRAIAGIADEAADGNGNAAEETAEVVVVVPKGVKRSASQASENDGEPEAKRPNSNSTSASVNGTAGLDSPQPESVASSNGDEVVATASATAANLYAALAADALEDEDDLMEEAPPPASNPANAAAPGVVAASAPVAAVAAVAAPQQAPPAAEEQIVQPIYVTNQAEGGQLIMATAPRPIIVSQGQMAAPAQQVLISTAKQQARPGTVAGHQLVVGPQGQVQLVTTSGAGQAGGQQYVLSTGPGAGGGQAHYVVAQPQTALVQGQAQTVLVTQTPQQQATGAKTIIILQPQGAATTAGTATAAGPHQKIVMTPQGQQVVVTQMQRPMLQASVPALVPTSQAQQQQQQLQQQVKKEGVASRPQTPEKPVVVVPPAPPSPPLRKIDLSTPFVCEWRGCTSTQTFKSANEVYLHVCESHCPTGSEEVVCLWDRCDKLKRKRFSLMTHMYDRHCNTEQVMKMVTMRRKQLSQSGRTEIPTPTPPPQHPGYAPDAALHAIKRHALEFVNPKELQLKTSKPGPTATTAPSRPGPNTTEVDDNEGPVTKSIRLTASLILRNLVIYCNSSRRYLRQYEPHLAGVALSNVESSRTIAQVLFDMNEGTTHR